MIANLFNRFFAERRHGPVAGHAGNVADKIREQFGAVRRVHNFRVELHRIDLARFVCDGGEWCAVGFGNHVKPVRDRVHTVAMAHPYLMARPDFPHAVKERALFYDFNLGAAELAMIGAFNIAA